MALGWLPAIGVGSPAHYVLPCVALGLQSAGAVARMTRASMRRPAVTGLPQGGARQGRARAPVIIRHGLRNAMLPVLGLVGLRIGGLLAGTVLVESVFAIPGVGRMMVDAVIARDFPMVQGGVLVVATMVVVVNALTDLTASWLDPRVRAVTGWLAFFRRDVLAAGAAVVLAAAVLAATIGPSVVPLDPLAVNLDTNYQPSSWQHPLGTDHLGPRHAEPPGRRRTGVAGHRRWRPPAPAC